MKNKILFGLLVLMLALFVSSEIGVAGNGQDSAMLLRNYRRDNSITHNGITDEIGYTQGNRIGIARRERRDGLRYAVGGNSNNGGYINQIGSLK